MTYEEDILHTILSSIKQNDEDAPLKVETTNDEPQGNMDDRPFDEWRRKIEKRLDDIEELLKEIQSQVEDTDASWYE